MSRDLLLSTAARPTCPGPSRESRFVSVRVLHRSLLPPLLLRALAAVAVSGCASESIVPRTVTPPTVVISSNSWAWIVDRVVVPPLEVTVRDSGGVLRSTPTLVRLRPTPSARLGGVLEQTTVGGVVRFDSLVPTSTGPVNVLVEAPALGKAASFAVTVRPAPLVATTRRRYAIVDVTVIAMDGTPPRSGMTVVVDTGVVVALGPAAETTVPDGAVVIDGRNRWVIPGLIDFHTHERAPTGWPDDFRGNALMYLANGVTTIVNMGDFNDGALAAARSSVSSGEFPGPRVFVGLFARGPADGGTPHTIVASTADAVAAADRAAAGKYDFIKVYDGISAEVWPALVSAASSRGLPIVGHDVRAVGLRSAIGSGHSMVVHAAAFLNSMFTGLNPSEIPGVVAELRSSGTAVTPTLHVSATVAQYGLSVLGGGDPLSVMTGASGAQYMHADALVAWRQMLQARPDIVRPVDLRPRLAFLRTFTKAMADAGVPLVLGTDNIGIPGIVPGFSMHQEVAEWTSAGIANETILAAGTAVPGDFVRQRFPSRDLLGRILVGYRADLLLLAANPLDDLRTLHAPAGVMADGRYYDGEALRAALATLIDDR